MRLAAEDLWLTSFPFVLYLVEITCAETIPVHTQEDFLFLARGPGNKFQLRAKFVCSEAADALFAERVPTESGT
jgi:hypothetical protein